MKNNYYQIIEVRSLNWIKVMDDQTEGPVKEIEKYK